MHESSYLLCGAVVPWLRLELESKSSEFEPLLGVSWNAFSHIFESLERRCETCNHSQTTFAGWKQHFWPKRTKLQVELRYMRLRLMWSTCDRIIAKWYMDTCQHMRCSATLSSTCSKVSLSKVLSTPRSRSIHLGLQVLCHGVWHVRQTAAMWCWQQLAALGFSRLNWCRGADLNREKKLVENSGRTWE